MSRYPLNLERCGPQVGPTGAWFQKFMEIDAVLEPDPNGHSVNCTYLHFCDGASLVSQVLHIGGVRVSYI